jgi:2,3-bisphosphoglycerate-dependent phosphoglycerate mutase/probable phosphoglycerate mutase
MEIYLIRHAQSTYQVLDNREDVVFDPHLTDLGHHQVALLAEYFAEGWEQARFADSGIDRLVCSPMWRALRTTRPLAGALDLKPEVWVEVHEQMSAKDVRSGSTRKEMQAAFPSYRLPDEISHRGWCNRREESGSAVMGRAIRVARDLWQRAGANEHLAIVSHVRFIDSLLEALLDQLPGRDQWYHHGSTGVGRLALTEAGVEIRYINRLAHFPPDLAS